MKIKIGWLVFGITFLHPNLVAANNTSTEPLNAQLQAQSKLLPRDDVDTGIKTGDAKQHYAQISNEQGSNVKSSNVQSRNEQNSHEQLGLVQQYNEGTCLLIASERDRYTIGTPKYQKLSVSFNRHCSAPRKTPAKSLDDLLKNTEQEVEAASTLSKEQGLVQIDTNSSNNPETRDPNTRHSSIRQIETGSPLSNGAIEVQGNRDSTDIHGQAGIQGDLGAFKNFTAITQRIIATLDAMYLAMFERDNTQPPAEQIFQLALTGLVMFFMTTLLLFFLFVLFRRDTAKVKGEQGERAIAAVIRAHYRGEQYGLFTNLLFAVDGDKTTEVDLLLIRPNFVLVIESKNYRGWIFASQRAKNWEQVIYRKRSSFQNPLHQNYAHCEAVKTRFEIAEVESLVVFGSEAKFKTPYPMGVISVESLAAALEEIDDRCREVTVERYNSIIELATQLQLMSDEMALKAHSDALKLRLSSQAA